MARVGRVAGRGATVAWLLFAISLVRTPGVAAMCGEIPDPEAKLAGGEIAFVGVAEYVTGTYWAGFHVEEVWFDGDLPEWLEVAGSPEEKPWVTDLLISVGSTDRSWKVGSRYLAFPRAFAPVMRVAARLNRATMQRIRAVFSLRCISSTARRTAPTR